MSFQRAGASHSAALFRLVGLFLLWKLLLLVLAANSPGPGYDTSTTLLLPALSPDEPLASRLSAHVLSRLVRWDALYFVSIANRHQLYEQEWAFGWTFTRLISHVAKGVPHPLRPSACRQKPKRQRLSDSQHFLQNLHFHPYLQKPWSAPDLLISFIFSVRSFSTLWLTACSPVMLLGVGALPLLQHAYSSCPRQVFSFPLHTRKVCLPASTSLACSSPLT